VTSIRARAGTDAGGWFEIPSFVDGAERDQWAEAVVDAVARAHGDHFDREASPAIRLLAADAANGREGSDLLMMAFLPTARPIMSIVRVRMVTPQPVQWWRGLGFALTPIRTENMGYGMLATRTFAEEIDEHRLVGHQSAFIFSDGDLGIVVSIEPTAALVFDKMQEGLTEIVGTLTVEFDDERTFVGARVTELFGTDADTWNIGMHVTA